MLNINDEDIIIKSDERINSSSFDSFLDSTVSTSNGNELNSFESNQSPMDNCNKLVNDQSNLDIVDFIEVNNDLINIDQEYLWLCDPKSALHTKLTQQQKHIMKQHQIKQDRLLAESIKNSTDNDNCPTNSTTIQTSNIKSTKKNPYKWMMEEFEDKNLDKVKRTLLVALDDISKGFNRRSRSVSTTRTPYFQQQQQQQQPYYNNNSQFMYQQQQQHQQQQETELYNDFNDLSIKKQQVLQSKSIESLLNESSTDQIDSYSTNVETDKTHRVNNNYSSATIVKKKTPRQYTSVIRINDPNLSTIDSVDITADLNVTDNDKSNVDNDQQLYEDITDVQVIAKMQEETLRQSVLSISKTDINKPHRGYSTATIVKRTSNGRPALPSSNYDYENNPLRRDSASSSDHSSMSSTASNNGSPYASHVNVNVGYNNAKPIKKNEMNSAVNIRPINNYQTITKTSSSTQKMLNFAVNSNQINSLTKPSSRSTTPSKHFSVNSNNILKHESRLPTPRSRGSMDGPLSLANGSNKPPPSPLQAQNTAVPTGRTGRAPMAYGGQRSATTSIVPMIGSASSSSSINTTNWQQSKFNRLQKQQQILPKQPQVIQQQAPQRTSALSRTSTNQSISSSNSSSNITTSSTNPNSTISPSSSSSVSTSSSMHQIAPMNSSSPRSRHTSPSLSSQYSSSNSNKIVISPSGLLTDGPLGRRPLISPSPLRDRSTSPVYDNKKSVQLQPGQLSNQLNVGSNSSLHTIQESKIPTSSPLLNKKQQIARKSFLPQPVFNSSQAVQPANQDSANWKDGCY